MGEQWPPALLATLGLAVPLWMHRVKDLSSEDRDRIAKESGQVVASQGDILQYGSKTVRWGHGAEEEARHRAGPPCAVRDCHCGGAGCADTGCYCHGRGEPSYSAGEVFNFLARGLACLACQPGGVTFAGRHWCAGHRECTDAGTSR